MEHPDTSEAPERSRSALYGLAAVAILYLASQVLVPVALAILLTFVVAPPVAWIERRVRSRALAVLLAAVLVTGVLAGGSLFIVQQFVGLADDLPTYRDTIVRKVRSIRAGPAGLVGRTTDALRRMGDDIAQTPSPQPVPEEPPQAPTAGQPPAPPAAPPGPAETPAGQPATAAGAAPSGWMILAPLVAPLSSGAIVVLLLVMMLMSRENIRDRIIRLAGLHQIGFTTQTLEEAGARVGRYLRAQLLINTMFAVAVGTGLLILGLPNAVLCGLIAGVLRFIPILGPWLAAAIPAALALAVFDGWYHLVMVVALFSALELLANIVLEPWLYGSSTGLSSFGIILAIVFWTWVWGAVGLVLAVPMTVCIVVFTRHIPHLSALAILLGDEPVLADSMRYYQRLLCRDEAEAGAILAAAPPDADPAEVLDQIVVPSLAAARADQQRGLITSVQAARIGTAARELAVEWLADRDSPSAAPSQATPPGGVVCLPAQDGLDEAAAAVLADLLRRDGIGTTVVSAALLFSERVAAAEAPGVRLIIVSSVALSSDLHTRRICKTLQRIVPGIPVIVVAWVGDAPVDALPAEAAAATAHTQVSTNRQVITLVKSLLAVQPARDTASAPAPPGA